jgi:hypothetical protein
MLIVSILIFCIVLFLYLHIHFHLKRSNDLEVYEIDQPSKQRLEEVCDIRQPTTFEYYNEQIISQLSYQAIYNSYRAFDVNIRDVSKMPMSPSSPLSSEDSKNPQNNSSGDQDFVLYIPVAFKLASEALKTDTEAKYMSENNGDFIEETGLIKTFQLNDDFLRPYMVSKCMYDIYMASTNTVSPLRYDVNYRNYLLVSQGSIRIMLIPPKDTRYLHVINDYDIFEFRSPVNPWKVQPEYQDDFDKIKTLEVELYQGMAIFIPAYWWYSIKFIGSETSVCSFKYRTYMNTISIMPQMIMSALQNINTKRDTIEKRAIGKTQIQRSTTTATKSAQPVPQPSDNKDEYSPSIDEQYLPKSVRGNNSNPYNIMNAMTDSVPKLNSVSIRSDPEPMPVSTVAVAAGSTQQSETLPSHTPELETVIASIPASDFTPSQKEVRITSS